MRPSIISPEAATFMRRLWLLLAGCLLLVGVAQAEPRLLRGTVTHVSDGDSVWIRPERGGAPKAVRLRGIDAPEICQRHGQAAREALAGQVLHRPVVLQLRGRDSYQRLLGELATPRLKDVGAWMVSQGHAWSPGYRGRSGPYAKQQARARAEHRGLWRQPGAMAPRNFRQRHGSCH